MKTDQLCRPGLVRFRTQSCPGWETRTTLECIRKCSRTMLWISCTQESSRIGGNGFIPDMSQATDIPEFARHLVNLASPRLGGEALETSDDFFAPKERLLHDSEPAFVADKFDDHGKWMDGWETRRKRIPGHDWCIIKLVFWMHFFFSKNHRRSKIRYILLNSIKC